MQNEELAGRWTRLGASLIDGIIAIVITMPFFSLFGVWEQIERDGTISMSTTIILSLLGMILFLVIHGYYLASNGQTVGKKLLDIKIVDLNGDKPEFTSLIAKRYLPIWLVSQIPIIGGIITLADALFIFRKDKRCIHDIIAGTRVVENTTIDFDKKSTSNPF